MVPVPNSAPDSLAPRNCRLPLEAEDEDDAEEPAAEAELVALPLALVVVAAAAAAAAELVVSTAAAEEVVATTGVEEEEEEATVGAASAELELEAGMAWAELAALLLGDLLLQFLRWTPGAARAQAARPAASMEEETRIMNERGGLGVKE